jgi:hypothetical protein
VPIIVDNGQGNGRKEQPEEGAENDIKIETFTLLKRLGTTIGKPTLFLRLDDTKTKVIIDPDGQP